MTLHVLTGGAGFIASNLIHRLIDLGETVFVLDDLSRGRPDFWAPFQGRPRFRSAIVDCADLQAFRTALRDAVGDGDIAAVWHLAANSDIPAGIADPRIDLQRTFMTTFNTLVLMREFAIPTLHFASSSAIYGDHGETAIHEDIGPLEPISNYGAMKLASEAQIRAAVEAFLPKANVVRFPNVVGVPATHGVIVDFVDKLQATPHTLDVLGDGTQRKAYLHVEELVDAMLFIAAHAQGRYNVFNVGPPDQGVTVRAIAETVRDRVAPDAEIRYGTGGRGWVGDVPRFRYATDRLAALGWRPRHDSIGAVRRAVDQIAAQERGRG
ncbi:NAD-dependent epimerase/dehydratase family protein [Methylobacterium sp. J-030]|uniref:NAD-dependent epimerase/dehydratase family protein n=1 Tax=Methylobacterium sp. J-030 TaxID=2836627 RepID=UPI001FBB3F9F|nr:NAD-dependent epimerase/dehydratase family protein [Methylobacterium sp. J-030]MCJ2072053.1 NAD-dependent epimerase/dehydratase family protein [Methylobacterium sp. J-030]